MLLTIAPKNTVSTVWIHFISTSYTKAAHTIFFQTFSSIFKSVNRSSFCTSSIIFRLSIRPVDHSSLYDCVQKWLHTFFSIIVHNVAWPREHNHTSAHTRQFQGVKRILRKISLINIQRAHKTQISFQPFLFAISYREHKENTQKIFDFIQRLLSLRPRIVISWFLSNRSVNFLFYSVSVLLTSELQWIL